MELINQQVLEELVNSRVDEVLKDKEYQPRTAGLTQQIRKDLFHGKSAEWVRVFIFDRYPETNELEGGWVINPRKSPNGKTTSIWIEPARKWLDDHELEIDWNEKLGG